MHFTVYLCCFVFVISVVLGERGDPVNKHAKKLYKTLMKDYNKRVRPVLNESDTLEVRLLLKLSQVLDVDERNQVLTTNAWVLQEWTDDALSWNPAEYGGVDMLYVPSKEVWHPDIVLYNPGDGNYELTAGTKVTLHHYGRVQWWPPASLHSSCDIDVTYFPFDEQHCHLQFGSWTYNMQEVDLVHFWQNATSYDELEFGIDCSEFQIGVEWDILHMPARKERIFYAGSKEHFTRITFSLTLRRKFLFYTVNLIVPLVSHAFITVLSFYLPSSSKKKITLVINILLSLTVFFLMLAEIIPTTSIVVPLLGKYLIFTLILVFSSVMVTTFCFNVHFRSSATHTMPDWTRKVFLYWLPRILHMRRPKVENSHDVELKYIKLRLCSCLTAHTPTCVNNGDYRESSSSRGYQFGSKRSKTQTELMKLAHELDSVGPTASYNPGVNPDVQRAIDGAINIAQLLKQEDLDNRTKEDWRYVALVIDRLFLWIYMAVFIFGSAGIICQAPTIFEGEVKDVCAQHSSENLT